MRTTKRRLTKLAFALYSLGLGASAGAQVMPLPAGRGVPQQRPTAAPTPVETRWKDSFDAFAAADLQQAPQAGGVLFVGSSSIRLWDDLETQFEKMPVIKRGFGGSRMLDVAAHVDQLVLPYKPRLVVVYAGDNDLAEGRTPQQVLDSFVQFVERVHAELPDTRIAYLSIKPSPSRAALMPQATQANTLIAAYSASTPQLDFIDIYTRMLDAEGKPRGELFSPDALHLNPAGYAVWKSTITPHLAPRPARGGTVSAATLPTTPVAASQPAP